MGICTHSFGDRHPQFRLTSVYHNLEYPEIILNHIKNTRLESTLVLCFWQLLFLLWFCQLVQISCRCHWVGGRWDRGALRYWPSSWFSSWHPICHPVVGHFIGHPFGHPDYHPLGYPDCHPICHPVLGHVVGHPVGRIIFVLKICRKPWENSTCSCPSWSQEMAGGNDER